MLVLIVPLTACDMADELLGIPKRLSDTDSKAVGAACRHAGRALEDCFTLNPEAKQAGVFEGWRDMNDYMTNSKIEVVTPTVVNNKPPSDSESVHADGKDHTDTVSDKHSKKPSGKGAEKSTDKLGAKVAKMSAEEQTSGNSISEKVIRRGGGRKPVADKINEKVDEEKSIATKPWQRKRDST